MEAERDIRRFLVVLGKAVLDLSSGQEVQADALCAIRKMISDLKPEHTSTSSDVIYTGGWSDDQGCMVGIVRLVRAELQCSLREALDTVRMASDAVPLVIRCGSIDHATSISEAIKDMGGKVRR